MSKFVEFRFESEEGRLQRNRQTESLEQKEAAPASQPAPPLIFAHYLCVDIKIINPNPSPIRKKFGFINNGDPYGNRTHVTAVKGRCLNRLTNGPYKKGAGLLRLNLVAAPGFEPGTLRV